MTTPLTFQRLSEGMAGTVWPADSPIVVATTLRSQSRYAGTTHAFDIRFVMDDGSSVVVKAR